MVVPKHSDTELNDCDWLLVPCHPHGTPFDVIPGLPLYLGRSRRLPPLCQLDDHRVSGVHCTFEVDAAGALTVTDRSTNGIAVNGRPLGRGRNARLEHGDIVDLTRSDPRGPTERPPVAYVVRCEDRASLRAKEIFHLDGDTFEELGGRYEAIFRESQAQAQAAVVGRPLDACYRLPDSFQPTDRSAGQERAAAAPAPAALTLQPFRDDGATPAAAAAQSRKRRLRRRRGPGPSQLRATEKLEEMLRCPICRQVVHQPVTCVPCLHHCCAGCLSEWLGRSSRCPQCRGAVTEARQNPVIAAVAADHVARYPELRRSAVELADLDAQNKLTQAVLKLKAAEGDGSSAEDDSTDDSASDATEKDDVEPPGPGPWSAPGEPPWAGMRLVPPFGSGAAVFAGKCRACLRPDARGYRCPPVAPPHHTCTACTQLFPTAPLTDGATQCTRCGSLFCDAYWGCPSAAGQGALKALRDHPLAAFPAGAFHGNPVELGVLTEYFNSRDLTAGGVWGECLDRLGTWHVRLSDAGWTTFRPAQQEPAGDSPTGDHSNSVDPKMPTVATVLAPEEGIEEDDVPDDDLPASPPVQEVMDGVVADGPDPSQPVGPTAPHAPTRSVSVAPCLTGDHVCCRPCAEAVFAQLLFLYRLEIPSSELPMGVRGRPYCWNGCDCRLQQADPAHCTQYNHACFGV